MRKPAQAIDVAAEVGERLGAGVAETSEVFGDRELVEGNREDRPLRAHRLALAFAVRGQVPEVLLELFGTEPPLAVASKDRLNRGLAIDLVENHYARLIDLGLAQGIDFAMQLLSRRHGKKL